MNYATIGNLIVYAGGLNPFAIQQEFPDRLTKWKQRFEWWTRLANGWTQTIQAFFYNLEPCLLRNFTLIHNG